MDAFARIVKPDVVDSDQPQPQPPQPKRRGRKPNVSKPCTEEKLETAVQLAKKRAARGKAAVVIDEIAPTGENGAADSVVVDDTAADASHSSKRTTNTAIKVYSAFVDHAGHDHRSSAPLLSISDDENVILQLKVSAPGGGGDNTHGTDSDDSDTTSSIVPYGYNKTATNTFQSKPFTLSSSIDAADDIATSITVSARSGLQPLTYEELLLTAPGAIAGGGGACAPTILDGDTAAADCCHAKDSPVGSRVVRLLMDFEEKSKIGEWPSNTSVCCHWCCHKFNTVPVGLPVKYVHERFQVVGCFCSLECAAAWNFASKESSDEIHERYALINLLSSYAGYGKVIRPSPDRSALAMFGGHMSIDDFRRFSTSNKAMMCSCTPMMSLAQQVEEISDSELRSEYKFIPLDKDRVNKYQEKIRLRRTKPLINYKNTLDCTMNLRYH